MDEHRSPKPPGTISQQFQALWDVGTTPPDVFRFLASHPDADSSERIAALRIDQQYRWSRGEPQPLQA